MQASSSPVTSSQQAVHPRLAELVHRHLRTTYRANIAAHSVEAYRVLTAKLVDRQRPLVVDSFCGTGHSTALLARRHPGHLVVGIDKSARRLAKHPYPVSDDYLLLRADCTDIWALLAQDGLRADFHYILYPNPWPKKGQIQRRVHGHASFPSLLQVGGSLELRSNWQLYVEEFGIAMHLAGQRGNVSCVTHSGSDLSLFEQKYRNSGHELWAYSARITP